MGRDCTNVMKTVVAMVLALAAPFLFPAVLSVVFIFAAAMVVPPVGLLAGVLTDALYRPNSSCDLLSLAFEVQVSIVLFESFISI